MTTRVVTPTEDLRLDIAARLYLGDVAEGVEALLAANQGLASEGYVTAGEALAIPAIDRSTAVVAVVRPWD